MLNAREASPGKENKENRRYFTCFRMAKQNDHYEKKFIHRNMRRHSIKLHLLVL